jgi:hypothetical protein
MIALSCLVAYGAGLSADKQQTCHAGSPAWLVTLVSGLAVRGDDRQVGTDLHSAGPLGRRVSSGCATTVLIHCAISVWPAPSAPARPAY